MYFSALTLSPELPQHGVPRPGSPRHNITCNSFFGNSQADISALWELIKDLQAGISALWEFVAVGKAGFSALMGERVNQTRDVEVTTYQLDNEATPTPASCFNKLQKHNGRD